MVAAAAGDKGLDVTGVVAHLGVKDVRAAVTRMRGDDAQVLQAGTPSKAQVQLQVLDLPARSGSVAREVEFAQDAVRPFGNVEHQQGRLYLARGLVAQFKLRGLLRRAGLNPQAQARSTQGAVTFPARQSGAGC